jgi:beta-mannosidase
VKNSALLLILSCFLCFSNVIAQTYSHPAFLLGTWTCLDSSDISVPGQLPGSLHHALIRSAIIPDPFIGTNEDSIQWVGEKHWVFTSDPFDRPDIDNDIVNLEADKVQLYTEWTLNGQVLGSTDNAFRPWDFNLTPHLKPSGNIIEVAFTPPGALADEKIAAASHPLPGDAERAVHRMPQFLFGWDWAPRLVDMSISKIAFFGKKNAIQNITLSTLDLTDTKASGEVSWNFEYEEAANMRYALTDRNGKIVASGNTHDDSGIISMPFEVTAPQLWWTHDLGSQYMYKLEVVAYNNTGLLGHQIAQVGIRTLELDTEDDKFQFVLNGLHIYAQGSNFVPCDVIDTRVNNREERAIIDAAIDANMNMIRVWGGGYYASDRFMDLCDEKGVLVWQDFIFACAMYPSNEDFYNSVSDEALYQTRRMRHHPSLAIFCGNNEVSEGWERWGWKDGLSEQEIEEVSNSYFRIDGLLQASVTDNTETPYWSSSPMLGRGNPEFKNKGDAHDWGIWHDGYPFDSLWSRVPRFMSEYGFQSFPDSPTFSNILSHDSILGAPDFRNHPEIVSHEKHPRGFDIIDAYIEHTHPNTCDESTDFETWSYLSRVIQAEGIAEGVIAGRLNQDHCSGTLVWQLNDCWPTASWSSIDGHGRRKLLHYSLKKAFVPILLHGRWVGGLPADHNSTLRVGITANPGMFEGTVPGTLIVYIDNLEDYDIGSSRILNLSVTAGETSWINLEDLLTESDIPNSTFIRLKWSIDDAGPKGVFYASDQVYCVVPGDLDLKKGSIYIHKMGFDGDTYHYEFTSDTFVKSVELSTTWPGHFDDNGFDLYPGEKKQITFTTYDPGIYAPGYENTNSDSEPWITATSLLLLSD